MVRLLRLSGLAFICGAIVFCSVASSNAQSTLLVDFQGNSGGTATDASAADFLVNDANIDPNATVETLGEDGFQPIATGTPFSVSGIGIVADIIFDAAADGNGYATFATGVGAFANNDLLSDYLFEAEDQANGVSPPTISYSISSIEEIGIGDTINLTVYAVGDADDQDNTVTITQGTSTVTAGTEADGTGDAFVQFSFINDGSDISVSIVGTAFANANGLSLTTVAVPEPGSLALLTLIGLPVLGRRRR